MDAVLTSDQGSDEIVGTRFDASAVSVPMSRDATECAGHVQQLGSESLLPNLMEVKG